jgi:hypothetical protein
MRRHTILTLATLPLILWQTPSLATGWVPVGGQAIKGRGAIAANSADAWVIGTNSLTDGGPTDNHQVYQWDGAAWVGRTGLAIQISVPSDGTVNAPWSIHSAAACGGGDHGHVMKWNGSSFYPPGVEPLMCATAIAVGSTRGPGAFTWIISADYPVDEKGDRTIKRYSPTTGWTTVSGSGVQLAVDGTGTPWVINGYGTVYQGQLDGNGMPAWTACVPGGGTYLAAAGSKGLLLGFDGKIYSWAISWTTMGFWDPRVVTPPGTFQIAAIDSTNFWALDGNGMIYRYSP